MIKGNGRLALPAGLLLALFMLIGCSVSSPRLPKTEKIGYFKAGENVLLARGEEYTYSFSGASTRSLYDRWLTLKRDYGDAVRGMTVNFEANGDKVNAQYNTFIRVDRLKPGQKEVLQHDYSAQSTANPQELVVTFQASGYSGLSRNYIMDDGYVKLDPPITVSINDKTRGINPLLIPLIIPAFPFIMAYGCAKGPCV
ncbi:hypothetical protein C3369_10395 [Escherichia sp. ESNIH1]|uniref:hypothetical protein n=1 Tax=Escherichia sp. ESNIH1 TaxID=1985876 RepID=UPI000CDDBC24|nr:hypothetical protein [Escherichia sp. ESNIH1]POU01874.1 hypothetical protein C3369_10395 [Escherichia sp. ESNIH1]